MKEGNYVATIIVLSLLFLLVVIVPVCVIVYLWVQRRYLLHERRLQPPKFVVAVQKELQKKRTIETDASSEYTSSTIDLHWTYSSQPVFWEYPSSVYVNDCNSPILFSNVFASGKYTIRDSNYDGKRFLTLGSLKAQLVDGGVANDIVENIGYCDLQKGVRRFYVCLNDDVRRATEEEVLPEQRKTP